MSDVPAEISREILSRLPVAPLLRFRCVSKQWKSLIDSNQFLKDHLDHSRKSNSHLNIIMRDCYLHSVDFDSLNETNQATFQELSHPLKTPSIGTDVLGSCDGLLALSNGEEEEDDNIFWNPSARRFHKLPFTGIEFPVSESFTCCQFIVYGFGYDLVSDDYKLVRIVQFYGESNDDFDSEVKVYNLKSDSWRRIPDFPYYLKYKRGHGELANGALHWVVSRRVESDTDSLVAALDLGTEEYRLVPLPEYGGDDIHMNVVVLGGCLSIMCNDYMNHVDIWVMKEYRVQDSWTILFTLRQSDVFPMKFESFLPIAYSKCGRKVLVALDGRLLMWYDLDKKSADLSVVHSPIENCFEFYPCLQSLVLLNSGTCDFDIVTKKKQKKKSKKRGSGKRNDFLSEGFNLAL